MGESGNCNVRQHGRAREAHTRTGKNRDLDETRGLTGRRTVET